MGAPNGRQPLRGRPGTEESRRREAGMGEALNAAQLYYERFQAGDFQGATGLFDSACVTVTPAGPW